MNKVNKYPFLIFITVVCCLLGFTFKKQSNTPKWSEEEKNILRSLWIQNLSPLPNSFSNKYADDSLAAKLGQYLFFDTSLSSNNKVSCSSCHQPDKMFTDGLKVSKGIGSTLRNSLSIIGSTYNTWYYWDGRRDNAWSQALTPLEAPDEMGGNRGDIVLKIIRDKKYKQLIEKTFGKIQPISAYATPASPRGDSIAKKNWEKIPLNEREVINHIFSNIGKAIEAYERKLQFSPSRFDKYIENVLNNSNAQPILNALEIEGLKLFISEETKCLRCHNGPHFTNNGFHNTGIKEDKGVFDLGRIIGVNAVFMDEFNCLGKYSDAKKDDCKELKFLNTNESLAGAFKVPSLRNVQLTAPYMHTGNLNTLEEVLDHYIHPSPARIGNQELIPLNISEHQKDALIAFLKTLNSTPY